MPLSVAPNATRTSLDVRAIETAVVSGDVELAIQPISELLHVPGADLVGAIPVEIQYVSVFTAAAVAGSKNLEASKRLIAFLASEKATAAIKKGGMELPRLR